MNVSPSVSGGFVSVATTGSAATLRADSAVADYSRDVAGKGAVVASNADRDDVDLEGHRVTELTIAEAAA